MRRRRRRSRVLNVSSCNITANIAGRGQIADIKGVALLGIDMKDWMDLLKVPGGGVLVVVKLLLSY